MWFNNKIIISICPPASQVRHPADTSNFDHFPPNQEEVPPDDTSGWDKEFGPLQDTPKFCFPGYK